MAALPLPKAAGSPLWLRSLGWLLLLGPFFFLSYGFANQQAAARGVVTALFFAWERQIPFVPWTIVPYWSIDLLYGLSFLLCRTPREVDRHAWRLLTAQLISTACFLAVPLRFAFERPHVGGFFGALFDALMGFDLPYNQAPSLHIGLLVIIWARFAARTDGILRMLVHVWGLLIGVSVLTTFQHHFIDIPTGAAVGFLCLWLWPSEGRSPIWPSSYPPAKRQIRLAASYLLGALITAALSLWLGGAALWGLWLSLALLLTAAIYLGGNAAHGFQKRNGRHTLAASVLLAPYRLGARINAWLWTRKHRQPSAIDNGVWLGRHPGAKEFATAIPGGFAALLDLCPELAAPRAVGPCISLPWLDLVVPAPEQLADAAQAIESARRHGPLLVCCALGYSRSACAVAAWLYRSGRCPSIAAAIERVQACRPQIVLSEEHRQALLTLEASAS